MDHPLFSGKSPLQKVVSSLPPIERALIRHSYNVDKISRKICRDMQFDRYQTRVVSFAAKLHDCAKFLPEFRQLFFEHKGRFNYVERQKAAKHAYASALVVKKLWEEGRFDHDLAIVAPATFMIAGHHDCTSEAEFHYRARLNESQFDPFSGYCRGLFEFPVIGGRVLKVADCFVTAMEKRHYPKPILNSHEAYAEIASESGEVFHAEVVMALERVLYV